MQFLSVILHYLTTSSCHPPKIFLALLTFYSWTPIFLTLQHSRITGISCLKLTHPPWKKSPCWDWDCVGIGNMTRPINHRLHASIPHTYPPEAFMFACKHIVQIVKKQIVPGLHREVCVSLWLWQVSQCPECLEGTRCRLWLNQTGSPLCLTSDWVKTDFFSY